MQVDPSSVAGLNFPFEQPTVRPSFSELHNAEVEHCDDDA